MRRQGKMYLYCPFEKKQFSASVALDSKDVECPYCKKKHDIAVGEEQSIDELQQYNKALPKYIDYWNYGPVVKTGSIKINGTFFNHHVIRFTGNENWMVCNPMPIIFKGQNKGIPFEIYYNGIKKGEKSAKVVDGDIERFWGIRWGQDGMAKIVNDIQRARYKKSRETKQYELAEYKTSCGKSFSQEIGKKIFLATYYSWLISEKNETTDEGETLDYSLEYIIKDGIPSFRIEFTNAHTKSSSEYINVNGENISISTISILADKLGHQQISSKKINGNSSGVQWYLPTNWMDISELKNAKNIYNAVYMWWGEHKVNKNDIFLYIGIVGANSKEHSVFERITEEMTSDIAYDFDVVVKQFRYSMMKDSGNESVSEILKTVEMQCINNISSIFPVHGNGQETIIKSFLGENNGGYSDVNIKFAQIGDGRKIILINRSIRYHNT